MTHPDRTDARLHEDGTVSYWSVYQQQWIDRARTVSDQELAAMSRDEREIVRTHLAAGASGDAG